MRFLGPQANAVAEVPTFDQIPAVPTVPVLLGDGGIHSATYTTAVTYICTVAIPSIGIYKVRAMAEWLHPATGVGTVTSMDYTGTETDVGLVVTKYNITDNAQAFEKLTSMTAAGSSATASKNYMHVWEGVFEATSTGNLRFGLNRGSGSAALSGIKFLEAHKVG